jgi:hypothetical protein
VPQAIEQSVALGLGGLRGLVADFVPDSHPIRLWADTFPWDQRVDAIEQSIERRFPKKSAAGRPGVQVRVLQALELLKHELTCSDEAICDRLRTDFAVMYAWGIHDVQVDRDQAHFVCPETLSTFRARLDEELMDELLAIQSAAAMDAGLVSPAHVLIDTFPAEQDSQRVTDTTTLYKDQKKGLHVIDHITQHSPGSSPVRVLQLQSQVLMSGLKKAMRRFGRQCRGQGRVFVKVVGQTERHLLTLGKPLDVWAATAQTHLQNASEICPAQCPFCGDQPQAPSFTATLRSHLLRARPDGKFYQESQDLFAFGPHVMSSVFSERLSSDSA